MEVTLPEEYAQERCFNGTPYDVHLGLQEKEGVYKKPRSSILIDSAYLPDCRQIVLHDGLTYTVNEPLAEASKETMREWADYVAALKGNCVVRFERADFTGVHWDDMKAYYNDLLDIFNEYGYSWWSNDYWLMTDRYPQTAVIAESPIEPAEGYDYFNKELLELLQAHKY